MTYEQFCQVIQPFCNDGVLRYEGFMKLVLPRDNPMLRSFTLARNDLDYSNGYITKEVGMHLLRYLEYEAQTHTELTLRKRRLRDNFAREEQDIAIRAFYWLQEASMPGMSHISPLALRRLLHEQLGAFSVDQNESLFRRLNVSCSGMLSFDEFTRFLSTELADSLQTSAYIANYTTPCPGCGVAVQREGGACVEVKCAYCVTSFRCVHNADGTTFGELPRLRLSEQPMPSFDREFPSRTSSAREKIRRLSEPGGPQGSGRGHRSSRKSLSTVASPGDLSDWRTSPKGKVFDERSVASQARFDSPRQSFSSGSPYKQDPILATSDEFRSSLPNEHRLPYERRLSRSADGPKTHEQRLSGSSLKRRDSLPAVLEVMSKQIAIDSAANEEKKILYKCSLVPEAVFALLDRYGKGYIADTDIWQFLHDEGAPANVSFAGVCSLLHELNIKDRMNLAQLVHLLCPAESLEVKNVSRSMSDDETRNVLYMLRYTTPCPQCGMRAQRTVEGCSSVTCALCYTAFRCSTIENARSEDERVSYSTRYLMQRVITQLVDLSQEDERVRKSLHLADSSATVIMDSFLELSNDRGYFDVNDLRRKMSAHGHFFGEKELDRLRKRYSQEDRVSFPDFVDQLRPHPHAAQVAAY